MTDFGLTTVIFKPHFKHFNFRNLSRLVTWLAILVKTGILGFLDSGRKSWTLDSRRWTLDAGLWTLDAGRWTLDSGRWALDAGRWALSAGLWTLDAERWALGTGHYL